VVPAKFGLLGITVFLGAAVGYGSLLRTALRRNRRSGIALTLAGFGLWATVGLPLGFPIEDKGASLALVLLLALAFTEAAGPPLLGAAALDDIDAGAAEARRTSR
jgi:hypothetical protein